MKSRILLVFLFLAAFVTAAPVLAQDKAAEKPTTEASADATAAGAASDTTAKPAVDEEAIKNLITTLESETARTEFISNLKLLLTQEQKQEEKKAAEPLPTLTKELGLGNVSGDFLRSYHRFLSSNGLDESVFGRSIVTLIITIIGIGILLINRRLMTKLLAWAEPLSHKYAIPYSRLRFYTRAFRGVLFVLVFCMYCYAVAVTWGVPRNYIFESRWILSGLSTFVSIAVVIFVLLALWEAVNFGLSETLRRAHDNNQTRVKTLLPLIRNIIFSVFAVLFGLVLLSELGINVAPLLAGAGVIGVAIGFGAQNFVKDFITGFTIILEDLMRVGDTVRVGQYSGAVEKITLRKIQLRGSGGTVFTIPFNAINTVENMTKEFSGFDFAFSISYSTDPDLVFDMLRKIDEDMRSDPNFAAVMMAPIDIWGVDGLTDTGVVIKGRITTMAAKQWSVQREFYKRLVKAFAASGIEMPVMSRNFQVSVETPPEKYPHITDPLAANTIARKTAPAQGTPTQETIPSNEPTPDTGGNGDPANTKQ